MTDTARPPLRPASPVGRGFAEPATVPIPRPGFGGGPGMPPPSAPPGPPRGAFPGAWPAPMPGPAPSRRRRPMLFVGVAASALLVLVVAPALLVQPGVLLPVEAPCEASPGSTLAGFPDDVVGPTDITGVLATSATTAPLGVRACLYGTPGTGWNQGMPPGGRGVRVIAMPRASVEGDPAVREQVRTGLVSVPTPRAGQRQVVLPRSGLTALVRFSPAEDLTATEIRCRTDDTYYDLAAGVSGTSSDDVATLDALAMALGCEPITGL